MDGGSFDQILDLDSLPDSNKTESDGMMPKPLIAFEESIAQQNSTAGNELGQSDRDSYPSEILCRGEPLKEHCCNTR